MIWYGKARLHYGEKLWEIHKNRLDNLFAVCIHVDFKSWIFSREPIYCLWETLNISLQWGKVLGWK